MASMGEYTLYDLPGKNGLRCWSPNTWRMRLIFAYKKIPYRTEWVEYPDLAPTFKALGLAPNPDGPNGPPNAPYTAPVVVFPDGTALMDSGAIGTRLEAAHASPPLPGIPAHTNAAPASADSADPAERKTAEFLYHIRRVMGPLGDLFTSRVVEDVVSEGSRAHREATILKDLDVGSLAEAKARFSWDAALPQLAPAMKEMGVWAAQSGGPFLMGDQPCWADVCLASSLYFLRCCGQDIFDHIKALEGADSVLRVLDTITQRGWFDRVD